jgi:hypothetical protein
LPLQRPARLIARHNRISGLNPGLRPAFEHHDFSSTWRQPAGGYLGASAALTSQHEWCVLGEVAHAQLDLFQRDVDRARRVRVTADKVKDPARIDNFRIEVEVPADLSDEHCAGAEEAVHHCLIHNTLLYPPKITIAVGGRQATIVSH